MKKIMILFIVCYFSIQTSYFVMASSDLQKLDVKSDEILQMVKVQRYDVAIQLLDSFSDNFLQATAGSAEFSRDEMKLIYEAYEETMSKLKNEQAEYRQKVNAATKLRLVVDAVCTEQQPLWTKMEEPMMMTFDETIKAVSESNSQMFDNELDDLLEQYDLIYSSLQVDLNHETIQLLDARFHYVNQYRPQVFLDGVDQRELQVLQYEMQAIFDEMKEDEADPSLWWVIISTGSVIIATLSYVGWRKYRGLKEGYKYKNKQKD